MNRVTEKLTDVLDSGSVLTIQPGGNHGDELIYRGFDKIAERVSLPRVRFADGRNRYDIPIDGPTLGVKPNLVWLRSQARCLRHRYRNDIDAVYVHGGGNFNDAWNIGVICYQTATRYFDCPVVVGPQSYRFETTDPATIFDDVDNETHLFCREEYSYRRIRAATADYHHVSVHLADDTALSLTAADLPVSEVGADYTLLAMRSDEEGIGPLIEEDVPAPIRVGDVSTDADSFESFVDAVARAEDVYTDRLHVAILATLLGKPVTWYEVGYHKSRGVYEYSLSDRDNITFVYKDEE